ncbi:MAG: dephospho-CoA kinase [bacterium]|nr:dephospho-CoA kinase [bacterium]
MKIIGITGPIGSGKSSLARLFEEHGCPVIDLDKLSHRILASGNVKKKVIRTFGEKVCMNGTICRPLLRKIVFRDRTQLVRLNAIIHPELVRQLRAGIASYKKKKTKILVVDAALIFELSLQDMMDLIITVSTYKFISYLRTGKMSYGEFDFAWRSQLPLNVKKKKAGLVISNNWPFCLSGRRLRRTVREVLDEMA